jgi:hypothetical protein
MLKRHTAALRRRLASLACAVLWLVASASASAVAAPPTKPPAKPAATAPGTTPAAPTTPGTTTPGATTPPTTPGTDAEAPPSEPIEPVEPEPTEEPVTPAEPAPAGPDAAAVTRLQAEARALRDELFKARARVSVVGSKLFTARIAMSFRSNLERFYTARDFTIRVDGAPVYVQESGLPQTAGDLFEVFAAPGSHELAVSVDLVARRDPAYKLEVEEVLTLVVPADARVSSRLLLRETGNMWRFAERRRGHTDLRVRLRASAKVPKGARKTGGAASSSTTSSTSTSTSASAKGAAK